MAADQSTRSPAYQALADDLRDEITSGRLRPGDRLPTEPQLCQRFGLSRSTVREALRLLASQHLVVTTRGVTGGSFVAQPDVSQVAETLATGMRMLVGNGQATYTDVLEIRKIIDIPAAALAADRRTADDLARLRACLFDPENPDWRAKVEAGQFGFHMALINATGNPLFEIVAGPLYTLANERVVRQQAPPEFFHRVDSEHRAILAAVEARNPAAAAAAARAHLAHLAHLGPGRSVDLDC